MKTRNIAIGVTVGLAIALSMGQGQLGGGGLSRVITNSPGLLAGSGTTSNPLTATIAVGTGITGTGSAGDPLTAAGGSTSINQYSGTHFEWNDDWLNATFVNGQNTGSFWLNDANGAGAAATAATAAAVSGRPGIVQSSTGTTSTGYDRLYSAETDVDLDEGVWTFEETIQIPTLSTGSEEFYLLFGFADNSANVNQVDGCFVAYDRANTLGTANAGNADKWELRDSAAGTQKAVLLDGSSQDGAGGAGAITTVDTPVSAGSWIRWKIVATTGSCAAYADTGSGFTLRATLTINVPTAATGLVVIRIKKSAGSTARTALIDQTRVAVDLTSARTP